MEGPPGRPCAANRADYTRLTCYFEVPNVTGQTLFSIGQLVVHRRFNYRGVIVDVDATFMESDAWYEAVAVSRPPKDEPWYRLLVDNAAHEAYVAQMNLTADLSGNRIMHPLVWHYFEGFRNGSYVLESLRSN